MILLYINSVAVSNLYQCYNRDEHHNLHHPDNLYFAYQNPEKNISLVDVTYLWPLSQIISSFAKESCWQTSGIFSKVWVNSSGLTPTRGTSWSSSMSGTKSFCSSPTLSKLAPLSFKKSRIFRFTMELRSKSRIFRFIMEWRSMPALCVSFTESCPYWVFMEFRHLRSVSALLGAEIKTLTSKMTRGFVMKTQSFLPTMLVVNP